MWTCRSSGTPGLGVAWALAGLVGWGMGPGLEAQAVEEAEPPRAAVQLERLLTEARVMSGALGGPVWDVQAVPGRSMIQLPMRVTPGSAGGVLEEPALDFSGGRFIAWALPSPGAGPAAVGGAGPTPEALMDLATLLEDLDRPTTDLRNPRNLGGGAPGLDVVGVGESAVPDGAPRLARELILTPGEAGRPGRVAWESTRIITGGVVKPGNEPYLLKLDPPRLRALEPVRGDRPTRNAGESSREFSLRRREQVTAERAANQAYRDLVDLVRALPERFETELPETVWAVYEVGGRGSEWRVRGGDAGPWAMSFEDFELLTQMAGGAGARGAATGDGVFTAEENVAMARLSALAADPHPWTQRLLATAVAASGYPGRAVVGDAAFRLTEQLLASPLDLARNRMVYALATTEPATPAVASLLEAAARRTGDPAIQLAALRSQLAVQLGDAAGAQGVANAAALVNGLIADADGPDAGVVVRQFLRSLPETPEATAAAVGGVSFTGLPDERFDAAVGAALESAGVRPAVVGGWLNFQLLGSNDAAVVTRTLDLLVRADEPAPVVGPLAAGLRRLIFARPDQAAEEALPHSGGGGVMLTAGLPLDSANHAMFRLLNAGDPELRRRGWLALRHFELTDQAGGRGIPGAVPGAGEGDPLTMIVDAGLGRPETPGSLVPFLLRQPDTDRADAALVQVVLRGDVAASRRAARGLRGSERRIDDDLTALSADDRQRFADRVYDRLAGSPEPVTGLMRQDRGSVVGWFASQVVSGELPPAAAWAETAGGEPRLLPLVMHSDEGLAFGAIAALTALAGGDRELQLEIIDRLKDDRTTATTTGLADAWADVKRDIYTARLADAAGEYRLVAVVRGIDPTALLVPPPPIEGDAASTLREERTVLGVTSLDADGRSISLRSGAPTLSVPDDRLAIRITQPGELKQFGIAELEELPLEDVNDPLDLLPQDGGVWRGSVVLATGQTFELLMEPMGRATPARGASSGGTAADGDRDRPTSGGEIERDPFR